jgi:arylsulfatase A-like enzyme
VTAAACSAPTSAAPTNVVVFVIDTLRADRLGAYGNEGALSPNFDALAERAALFEQAYAPAPWTLPSTVSLLTSMMPCEHGVLLDGDRVPEDLEPLAERLRRTGRATASFFGNPYAGPMAGLERGFDRAESVDFEAGIRVKEWLKEVGDRPFFLYIHNLEPHDPYEVPVPDVPDEKRDLANSLLRLYLELTRQDWSQGLPLGSSDNSADQRAALSALGQRRRTLETLYDAEVRLADARLGGVVEALMRHGAWDHTLLIVVSDHGEEFGEHGGFRHDQSLYEELLRVPLLVRFPSDAHAGRRVSAPVSLIDVVPTIAEVLEEPEVAHRSRGHSLLAHLEHAGGEPAGPRVLAVRVNRKKVYGPIVQLRRGDLNVALRDERWKAIWNAEPRTLELFDLELDPRERTNRSDAESASAHAFRLAGQKEAARCLALDPPEAVRPEMVLDPGTRERLEHLGYIDPQP